MGLHCIKHESTLISSTDVVNGFGQLQATSHGCCVFAICISCNITHTIENTAEGISAVAYYKAYLLIGLTYIIGSASIANGPEVIMSLKELSMTWKGIACNWTVQCI